MKLGPYLLGPNDDENCGIYTGDARELAQAIPDESVDIILTDPPYSREFVSLYSWLAVEGARVLRNGSYLFAYGACEHMPARLAGMCDSGLRYFWTFALLHNGSYPRLWQKKLMSGYKPIFVYTKGKPAINPWMSTVHTARADKRYHKWGQGEDFPSKMLEMLTVPGAIVVDFFCGGGQMAAASTKTGARYVCFEIDPATAELARARVRQTQPPLFVPQVEQQELAL